MTEGGTAGATLSDRTIYVYAIDGSLDPSSVATVTLTVAGNEVADDGGATATSSSGEMMRKVAAWAPNLTLVDG